MSESSHDLEEDDKEGNGLGSLEAFFEASERRVDLWMVSRGVWDLDCLPKEIGKLARIPAYISSSSSFCDIFVGLIGGKIGGFGFNL